MVWSSFDTVHYFRTCVIREKSHFRRKFSDDDISPLSIYPLQNEISLSLSLSELRRLFVFPVIKVGMKIGTPEQWYLRILLRDIVMYYRLNWVRFLLPKGKVFFFIQWQIDTSIPTVGCKLNLTCLTKQFETSGIEFPLPNVIFRTRLYAVS